jgi:phosphoribosylaminoimidazolecarboxamide formyltransferase/IMP cyclohydrolase
VTSTAVRRALISVSDKSGVVALARALVEQGIEVLSTGSTAAALRDAGIAVTSIEEVTGFAEALDGRVKTLHPAIHAGILADQSNAAHREQLGALGFSAIGLVVVNLYPFAETLAAGGSIPDLVEKIDIGGPALIRAAAKNHASVAVLTSPDQYPIAIEAIAKGGFAQDQRERLAAQAFAHVATYDLRIASWMSAHFDSDETGWPHFRGAAYGLQASLRYGENPHQVAALYRDLLETAPLEYQLAAAAPLNGKAMSYNNYVDAQSALRAVADFDQACVAIIKHTNPCGIAVADTIERAHSAAHACDPVSAFGGVIAANRQVNEAMARQVVDIFTEVILAPSFSEEALEILRAKQGLRILEVMPHVTTESRAISGGALFQSPDRVAADPTQWELVSGDPAHGSALDDLVFAWQAVRSVKSNAIVISSGNATVGVGMGQVNRVDAARLAVARAGGRSVGAVAASDAFFPFPDGVEVLIQAGVRAIVQPGGSVRDAEVIAAARAAGVTMYLTGMRHFAH